MSSWWEYWYVLPFAVAVSVVANASGFSGAVLFQPFFAFVLGLPVHQSIATGVATETIGMSSGTARYLLMRKVDLPAVVRLLPPVVLGVVVGVFVFAHASRDVLRLIVGLVVGGVALDRLLRLRSTHRAPEHADLRLLGRRRWVAGVAGAFSACTGTGVAELSQPLLERSGGLSVKRANATAIAVEAVADWLITATNLTLGNVRPEVLVFSASGVLVGAQVGALLSPRLPDRLLKAVFGTCVLAIGAVYVTTATRALL